MVVPRAKAFGYSKTCVALEKSLDQITDDSSVKYSIIALAFIGVLVVPRFAASLAIFLRLNRIDVTERTSYQLKIKYHTSDRYWHGSVILPLFS